MEDAILFVHLLGVALLIASVSISLVTLLRIQTARTIRELRSLLAGTKRVEVVIIPAMLLILGSGIYLASQHGPQGTVPWTAGWLLTSVVVTLLLGAMGPTVEASDDRRLRGAVASASGEHPDAGLRAIQRAARPTYVVFFGTAQAVALLFLMSNRPGLVVALEACVIAAIASGVAAFVRVRSLRRSAAAQGTA